MRFDCLQFVGEYDFDVTDPKNYQQQNHPQTLTRQLLDQGKPEYKQEYF